jgi:agmatine deiminase
MYKRKTGIVEGGAIDSNGRGTYLTSEECLMHPDHARNPNFTKKHEAVFKEYPEFNDLVRQRSRSDDTHGHIDIYVVLSMRIIVKQTETDNNYLPLQDNLKAFANATLRNGKFYHCCFANAKRIDLKI